MVVFAGGCAAVSSRIRPPRDCEGAEHQLLLPFSAGSRYEVLQGNEGRFSHRGLDRYAWDFRMPEGSTVVAAEDGVVVEVEDRYAAGGPDPALAERANVVVVDHGDRHFSVYQHLGERGALVEEGETVRRGQPVALSGNTGYSTEPHLHFEVVDWRNRSVPVCFEGTADRVPREAESYESADPSGGARATAVTPSRLPPDAFVDNDVILLSELPARRWLADGPVHIKGRVRGRAARVVALITSRSGRSTVRHVYAPVDATGRFTVDLELEGLEGFYGFALVAQRADAGFRSSFTVPIVIRHKQGLFPTTSAGGTLRP